MQTLHPRRGNQSSKQALDMHNAVNVLLNIKDDIHGRGVPPTAATQAP